MNLRKYEVGQTWWSEISCRMSLKLSFANAQCWLRRKWSSQNPFMEHEVHGRLVGTLEGPGGR